MAQKLKVLIAAAEAAPFAKVGGLADVVSSLARALSDLGVDVRIILPRYGSLQRQETLRRKADLGMIPLEVYPFRAALLEAELPGSGVPVYFVESADFFSRAGVYDDPDTLEGFADNFQRFAFFMKATLAACRRIEWFPDVVQCNDSHTALIPAYMKLSFPEGPSFRHATSLLVIHNLAYQGRFDTSLFKLADLPRHLGFPGGAFHMQGDLNLMKGGILFADVVTTVSPTYAREIQEDPAYGCGLEGVLHGRRQDLHGILNGMDVAEWNPATDPLIPARYHAARLGGKAQNKVELQKFFRLPERADVPLVGMVTRLVEQKGLDLLLEAAPELFAMDLQLALLGTGEAKYHEAVQFLARTYPANFRAQLAFDDRLAHWIEAGSDMFLMPSRYEPCGLSQMYSLRYGTVPVVRHTGGLADTVRDCHQGPDGNGFKFYSFSAREMLETLRRALWVWRNRTEWRRIMRRGMAEDFSWSRRARGYLELYRRVREKR